MPLDYHHSVCPHDCPSVCALEVERLDDRTIGRVRGARANNYTQGVICAKVARYTERVHHPDRLMKPLISVGAKGEGKFVEASWDEALDKVAEAFKAKAKCFPERVIIFRDGVGDKQIPTIQQNEIEQIKKGFNRHKKDMPFIFVMVNKRIKTKLVEQ